MSPRPICHTSNIGSQTCAVCAPTNASNATTTTQNHQYSQPAMKPAPSAQARAHVLGERTQARLIHGHARQ